MKHLKTIALLLLVAGMAASTLWAGESRQSHFQAGLNLGLGFPLGAFKENLDLTMWGGSGYVLWQVPNSFLAVGLSTTLEGHNLERRHEAFGPAIPEVRVDVTTVDCLWLTHALLRLQPRAGNIRPYADALVGFQYIWTETDVRDRNGVGQIAGTVNLDDWALNWGFGAGVDASLATFRPGAILLSLGARWLRGGTSDYLVKGSIERGNDLVILHPRTSRTDQLLAQVGITFAF